LGLFFLVIVPIKSELYFNYTLCVIFLIFFNGLSLSFTAWFNRNKQYRFISIARIIKNLSLSFFTIFFGIFLSPDSIYIIIANIIGIFSFSLFCLIIFLNHYRKSIENFDLMEIFFLLRKNLDFPKYTLPASIINIMTSQSPIIFLKIFFGEAIAGIYALVNRVMGAPSQLIAGATGEVYRQKASKEYNTNGNCYDLFIKTFRGLFLIAIIPFIVVITLGPYLFSIVFGVEWTQSGYLARYLSIFFLLRFCISPLSYTLIVSNKQNYNFSWQLYLFINTTISIIYGYFLDSYILSVISFSCVYSIMYVIYFREILHSAKGTLVNGKN